MSPELERFRPLVGDEPLTILEQLATPWRGARIVHVNSTARGGGVAEMLSSAVPYLEALGLEAQWAVIKGDAEFFRTTKAIHNALQGKPVRIGEAAWRHYEEVVAANAERLRPLLATADVVVVHDPQPAPLLRHFPERRGLWLWRCHIDLSKPFYPVWRRIERFVGGYDASIFSLIDFAKRLEHPQALIAPAIDPFAVKNRPLPESELTAVAERFGIDRDRPVAVQVSRYDRFKDPLGVIDAFRIARRVRPDLQLVLCGSGADDDPEGAEVLAEVRLAASDDPDIHVILLGPEEVQRTTNAIQSLADIVLQKSTREGFGLTVTEALWKRKPVIGGAVGGIRLQVRNWQTGFVVHTPEGAARRLIQLLDDPRLARAMGDRGRAVVTERFLMTRLLRDYLALVSALRREEPYAPLSLGNRG